MKKGGAAKGELVLAMYELANSFRNGWGIKKDPVAAKQYYETAANLGDTDAMNEVAWCYTEGFGCKKDKVSPLFSSIMFRCPDRGMRLASSPVCIDVHLARSVCSELRTIGVYITRSVPETQERPQPHLLGSIMDAADDATPHSSRRLSSYAWPSRRGVRR